MHDSWPARSSIIRFNPLRRTVDRIERAALAVAIGLAVVAVPVAVLAGATVRHAADATVNLENATTHPATALLLRDAPNTTADSDLDPAPTLGEWHTPDGAVRTGPVDAPSGTTAGMTVTIWLDGSGQPVSAPLTADQAYWRGVLTVTMLLVAAFAVITIAYLLTHWLCDRRRFAEWSREWTSIEPRWTHRD
ncbi:MAG TPA: hypothetical protein VHZ97_10920 [Pseudonocardiaceae bacterium]|jgi:hypothetical protein|nr:hypothetical protein [Pseudonocardiaceae bacterium]